MFFSIQQVCFVGGALCVFATACGGILDGPPSSYICGGKTPGLIQSDSFIVPFTYQHSGSILITTGQLSLPMQSGIQLEFEESDQESYELEILYSFGPSEVTDQLNWIIKNKSKLNIYLYSWLPNTPINSSATTTVVFAQPELPSEIMADVTVYNQRVDRTTIVIRTQGSLQQSLVDPDLKTILFPISLNLIGGAGVFYVTYNPDELHKKQSIKKPITIYFRDEKIEGEIRCLVERESWF